MSVEPASQEEVGPAQGVAVDDLVLVEDSRPLDFRPLGRGSFVR